MKNNNKIKKCECCGKEFQQFNSRNKFCSHKCCVIISEEKRKKREHRLLNKIKKCEWCGKEFHPFRDFNRFCSRECAVRGRLGRTRWNKKELKCDNCGKEILVKPYNVKKYKYHFCSKVCQNIYYKLLFSGKKNVMWGKTHTKKVRNKLSVLMVKKLKAGMSNTKTRGGKRQDLDKQYFRSSWEANYARYLNYLGIKWQYEIKTFTFPVKRGTIRYTPDFYLSEKNEYHEVKGWMTQKSRTALKRMKKYYPNVKILLIDRKIYKKIYAEFQDKIPYWEKIR